MEPVFFRSVHWLRPPRKRCIAQRSAKTSDCFLLAHWGPSRLSNAGSTALAIRHAHTHAHAYAHAHAHAHAHAATGCFDSRDNRDRRNAGPLRMRAR